MRDIEKGPSAVRSYGWALVGVVSLLLGIGSILQWAGWDLLATDFMPHGHCYLWEPDILWLHVLSDSLIGLSYFMIPVCLVYFVSRRRGLEFKNVFLLFGAFILLCGMTHMLEVYSVWRGAYRLTGSVKLLTGLVSLATAVYLYRSMSEIMAIPLPSELNRANEELRAEVSARQNAEASLIRREAQFETLMRASLNTFFLFENEGGRFVCTEANERAESLVKKGMARIVGSELGEIFAAGEWDFENWPIQDALDSGEVAEREVVWRGQGDGERWFTLQVIPVAATVGLFFRDITSRKREMVYLKENYDLGERILRGLVEIASDQGEVSRNPVEQALAMACELLHFEKGVFACIAEEGLRVENCYDSEGQLQKGSFYPMASERWERMIEENSIERSEAAENLGEGARIHWLDDGCILGGVVFVEGEAEGILVFHAKRRSHPFESAERRAVLLLARWVGGLWRQQQYVAEIESSSVQLRSAIESSPTGMMSVDERGRIVLLNGQIETLFGWSKEDLLGKSVDALVPRNARGHHRELREGFDRENRSRMMGVGRDLLGCRKDGSLFPVEVGLNPYQSDKGRQVMVSVVDISDRKEAERRLEDLNARLESSNEELKNFAYVASHDLKEPLRSIHGFLEILEEDYGAALPEEALRYIQYAVGGANRLRDMIDGLLEFSRLDTEARSVETVSLDDLAKLAIQELSALIKDRGVEVSLEEGMPEVSGDRGQLLRLFENLMTNAIKFAVERPPVVKLCWRIAEGSDFSERLDACGRYVVVSVEDNGIGIEERYFDRIFELFTRLNRFDDFGGSGIGLAACHKIVARHGGAIQVESQVGQGSCFRFALPLR